MLVEFWDYDEEKTDVDVMRDTLSKSTLHIEISNDDNGRDSIKLYMSEKEIEGFIEKLGKALERYQRKR